MRIAIFTDYFFPELGGIQDSIAAMSRALGRRGHRVDIYAPRYAARDYRRIGMAEREPDLGASVRVRRRPSLPFPSSTQQSRVALPSPAGWLALAGRAKPDVIHAHSFFGIGLEAILSAACWRIPVVGTNHTTVAGFGPHIPISVARASAYVTWFYNRCDYVTAPSRSVFDELGPAGVRRPTFVISNPIDTALFSPVLAYDVGVQRGRFGLTGPTITYAGRLGPEKNIDVLLLAVATLRDRGITVDLAIAGHGSHEPVLRALAGDLGIGERIKFLGTLSHDELAGLLQISDIFSIMSTSETQSMVLLQAMACGVPVIAARSRALPEFVGQDNGLLVEADNPTELADAMAALLAAPDRRRDLGCAGRRSAARFAVETVTDAWETLYRSAHQGSKVA